jgi:hypothetical protein
LLKQLDFQADRTIILFLVRRMKTIFALVAVAILMLGAIAAEEFATWQVRSFQS